MDLNSLYPSVIRALNMDPNYCWTTKDKLIHRHLLMIQMTLQKKSFAGAWEGKFGTLEYEAVMEKRKDVDITIDWENGDAQVYSAPEV